MVHSESGLDMQAQERPGRSTSSDNWTPSQVAERAHGLISRTQLRPQMSLVRGRAVVNFNNQNTVLLKLQISDDEVDDVVLLHDNRLFRISLDSDHVQPFRALEDAGPKPSADDLAQNIILRFQTSPKYRLLNALFLSFRLTDNLMLLTVAVLTVLNGKITLPDKAQIAVFSAIGVELFYDVLLMTSKFWFLERLSPYVGLGLYVMYFTICAVWNSPVYIWVVLCIRLAAFLVEESVDVAIDIEMHNDLLRLCNDWPAAGEELAYTDVRKSLLDFPYWPKPGFFKGSGSAWLPKSAFADETYSVERFPLASFRWLYVVPFAIFLPMALVIGTFVMVPMGIFLCAHFCLTRGRVRNASLWAEMRHTY